MSGADRTPVPLGYAQGGTRFAGFLADGSGGAKAPGVLVLHEGGGLTDHVKSVAERLAGEHGLVAYVPDLFGPGIELPDPARRETLAAAQAVVRAMRDDPGELRARLTAALAVLQARPGVDARRLAAIGYCFGGAAAIELARTGAPLALVAGFHAGIFPGTAADNAAIRGQVLLCHGAADPVVPATAILAFTEALTAAGKDWQLHLYGGVGHSFTNPLIDSWGLPGFAFDARADARGRAALARAFEEAFGAS